MTTTYQPARHGTAESYIREYLDPDRTIDREPMTEAEARELWAQLERVFTADGGTGMEPTTFTAAVGRMQYDAGFAGW